MSLNISQGTIDINTIVYIASTIVTVAGALGILGKIANGKIKKVTTDAINDAMVSHNEQINKELIKINELLEQHIKDNKETNEKFADTLMNDARMSINRVYREHSNKDEINAYTLQCVSSLYESYRALGGNTFIEDEMEYLHSLKIVN